VVCVRDIFSLSFLKKMNISAKMRSEHHVRTEEVGETL